VEYAGSDGQQSDSANVDTFAVTVAG
jgi:hypothetical protein